VPESIAQIESLDDIRAAGSSQRPGPQNTTQDDIPVVSRPSGTTVLGKSGSSTVVPSTFKLSESGPLPLWKSKRAKASSRVQAAGQDSASRDRPAEKYRPIARPPMLPLCVLDDGRSKHGEWIRIRADFFVIGRSEGDLLIPHDASISSRHAEIRRTEESGRFRFLLHDLGSRNGTFVRVSGASLNNGQQLLIGRRRYQFDGGLAPEQAVISSAEPVRTNDPGDGADPGGLTPAGSEAALVQISGAEKGRRHVLSANEVILGTDPQRCSLVIADDSCVCPRHARLRRDDRGAWTIENLKSRNGVWLRVRDVPLDTRTEFQLGEQRFFVRVP
jgi:pSer/pThr/pTyr-binding forkhead associated (FHA) protein